MIVSVQRLVGLQLIVMLVGCASLPAFQLKLHGAGETTAFSEPTTLVVKAFESDAREAVPPWALQALPEALIAQLNECYPEAFQKIARMASGAPEELSLSGTITEYDEGNRFTRFLVAGVGSVRLVVDVTFGDASGREVTRAEGRWVFAMGGIAGAIVGMRGLIETAGAEIADAVAKARGAKMMAKCARPGSR
jgi:uncharacterized protein DUF4410